MPAAATLVHEKASTREPGSAVIGNSHRAENLNAVGEGFASAADMLTLLNMWWHRVGFDRNKLPSHSEACRRCGGTARLLYSGGTCPNCDGTGLRSGVSSVHTDRQRGAVGIHPGAGAVPSDDGKLHLATEPFATYVSLEFGNRTALLGVPAGWSYRSATEIAQIQAIEGDAGRVIAQLYPLAATPDVVYAVTISSTPMPARLLASENLLELVNTVERSTGLRAASAPGKVGLGGKVGWLWHLEGAASGWLLDRPNQSSIPVHCAELWVPVDAGTALKILLTAPLDQAHDATAALDTMIASWRWDDQVDHNLATWDNSRRSCGPVPPNSLVR